MLIYKMNCQEPFPQASRTDSSLKFKMNYLCKSPLPVSNYTETIMVSKLSLGLKNMYRM